MTRSVRASTPQALTVNVSTCGTGRASCRVFLTVLTSLAIGLSNTTSSW